MLVSRVLRALLLLFALSLLSSCAGLKVNPPDSSTPTMLIIPVELDAKVVSVKHGFYYLYEITKANDTSFAYDVEIKFPVPGDMLIIDSLPPGDYYVRKFTFLPIGTGDKFYGNNSVARYDTFSLESGKVTIFSKSLRLKLRNEDPGRVGTIIYSFDIVPVTSDQENAILATLKQQANFDLWEVR